MSEKKKLNDEIEQELEESLDGGQDEAGEEDFTVKVHREDYTVKRRFYDKGKALETADSLRMDKRNVVEDNIENEFVTMVDEEDDVDWDKLVDSGLKFHPPISDAAEKKIEDSSIVAEELESERALVESDLDVTMTMDSKKKIKYPTIEPREEREKKETKKAEKVTPPVVEEVEDNGIEVDDLDVDDLDAEDLATALDGDTLDEEELGDEEELEEEPEEELEEFEETVKNKYGKSGGSFKKILALCLVVAVSAGLFYYFNNPMKTSDSTPEGTKKFSITKKTATEQAAPDVPETAVVEQPEAVSEPEQPVEVVAAEPDSNMPEREVEPVMTPEPAFEPEPAATPEVTRFNPYTIHISSYKKPATVISEVKRLRKKGLEAFSAFIEIPGKGVWYRIYAGYYDDYKKATAAAAEIKSKFKEDAIVAKTFYGVQVGAVFEKDDLAELESQLVAKDYFAYFVPVDDGSEYGRLIVGAYKKENDATALFNKLAEDGFDAEVVKK